MKTFTDATGRIWVVTADVNALRRVKDLAKVDLLDGAGLAKVTDGADLWATLELWPNVLWALCLPQIQAVSPPMTETAWAELLLTDRDIEDSTPVWDAAITATLEELACFFRKLGRRTAATALEKIVETRTTKETELATRTGAMLDRSLQAELKSLEQQLAKELELSTTGPPSTSSPA